MKAGDIVFVKGDSWISKIITWFDKGDYSHVAIATGENTVVEAQRFSKVREVEHDYEIYNAIDLDLTGEERDKIVYAARSMIGARYDYLQILGIMFGRLFRNRFHRNRLNDPRKLICSELVSHALYKAKLVPYENYLYDLTPNELYAMVMSLKDRRKWAKETE